ncbi:MAG: extracellular solute-binding protein [Lachnospiraceae bacterium]
MRKIKRVAALTMASSMILGLAACSLNGDNGKSTSAEQNDGQDDTQAQGSDSTDNQDDDTVGINSWKAFAENVTLTIPVYDRGVKDVPAVDNNYWTNWIQENFGDKYNITVKFESIPIQDVMTKYTQLANSNCLPTILMDYDYSNLCQWAAEGYLAAYDIKEFQTIAPVYYEQMADNDLIKYTDINEDTYFALANRPYAQENYTYLTFVRMDWLKKVGYDHIPNGRKEYLDAMKKIMDKGICEHPGGGQQLSDSGLDQNYAYRSLDISEKEWAVYGDYVVSPLSWDVQYNLLKMANEDYNAGITDPEYFLIDAETAKENFINGKSYSYSGYLSTDMDFLTAFYEQNPDAELALNYVPYEDSFDDKKYGMTRAYRSENPFGMIIAFSSQASEEEIRAAMMYMEWMSQEDVLFTMQWGIEGENFHYNEEGIPVSVDDYSGNYTQGYDNSKDYWCVTIESRNFGTIEQIIEQNSPKGLPQDFTEDIIDYYYTRKALAEDGYAIADCLFHVKITSVEEYSDTLAELYAEYRNDLNMCDPDQFDTLYKEFSQKYLDAGFQEIIDERLEAYKNGNTSSMK